MLKTMKLNK